MKTFLTFLKISAKNQTAYRGATVVYFFNSIFHVGVALLIWLAAENQTFPSFSKAELIGYYITLLFINWFTNWSMFTHTSREIKNGDIQKDLIRPYSYFASVFGVAAGFKLTSSIIYLVGTLVVFMLFVFSHAPIYIPLVSVQFVIPLVISLFFAIFLNFTFRFLLAIVAFWITESEFLDYAYYTVFPFLAGDLFPVSFLPPLLRNINMFLPFRYQLSFPIEIMFGKVQFSEVLFGIAVSIAWSVILFSAYKFLWNRGSKSYMAFGH